MPQDPDVQTIERTGKGLKAHSCLSSLLVIAGFFLALFGHAWDNSLVSGFGVAAVVIGLCWWLLARILIWWNHG